MIAGLSHLFCDERLRELGLHILEKRRLRKNLIYVYKCLKGRHKEDGAVFFQVMLSGRSEEYSSGYKLEYRTFALSNKEHFFTVWLIELRNLSHLRVL